MDSVSIDQDLVKKVEYAIEAALAYEAATSGKRKLGITGEVGEILICHHMGLRMMLDPRSIGYDALDRHGKRVEIKTRRSESDEIPKGSGRLSRFSEHEFDYALLGLLDHNYQLREIWQAEYTDLYPIITREKRRNPSLTAFKRVAIKIYP